jgi:hypothetical protein
MLQKVLTCVNCSIVSSLEGHACCSRLILEYLVFLSYEYIYCSGTITTYVHNFQKRRIFWCFTGGHSPPPPRRKDNSYGVQHGLVVSVLGCCTAAPGSNPARHPTLGSAGRKLFARMQESLTQLRKKEYPAGEHPEEE